MQQRRWRAAIRAVVVSCVVATVCVTAADPAAAVSVTRRRAGADRYATAAQVSRAIFAPGVDVAFVATGESFADALAGAAAAGARGGPLLLTAQAVLPSATATELDRLQPSEIVVLGGPAAVADAVLDTLALHTTGPVTRIAGSGRVETAAKIADDTWPSGAPTVYVANGLAFPDALGGGAAAAAQGAPVLLTTPTELPAATRSAIERLAPSRIRILGGEAAIAPSVEAELRALASNVRRYAGADRFATSAAVAHAVFDRPLATAVIANGLGFADALAAGAGAAELGAPVLLSTADCVPVEVATAVRDLEVDELVLVGGEAVLSTAVADLVPCDPLPPPSRFVVLHLHPSDVAPIDRDEAIRAELAAMQNWLVAESGTRRVRFERSGGQIEVRTLEVPVSSAELTFDAIASFLVDNGYRTEIRHVLAFVEGEESGACGRGGVGIAVYWNDSCGPPSESTAPDQFTVVAAISVHEIFHALGAVPDCAPNVGTDDAGRGHIVGDPSDIMSATLTTLDLHLDPGSDDYYGHGRDDCLDVADSLFLEPAA